MTTPLQIFNQYRDPVQQAKEMETFQRLQQASLENFQHLGLMEQTQAQTPAPSSPTAPYMAPGQPGSPATASQQGFLQPTSSASDPSAGLDTMTPVQLVDLASSMGVENAEKIPASALRQIIASRRADPASAMMPHGDWGEALQRNVANLGIGAARGLVGLADQVATLLTGENADQREQQHPEASSFLRSTGLDYAFDIADRNLSINNAKRWLTNLDEGLNGNLSDYQKQAGQTVQKLGSFLPYAGAGEGAFAGIGTLLDSPLLPSGLGRLAGTPWMRGLVQGAGTALMLDAGTDKPWMPSMQDLAAMTQPGSTITDQAGAALKLAMGSRLMDAATGGLIGGMFGMLNQQYRPGHAAADAGAWNLGSQLQLDAAQEIPSTYTMLQDGTILALPRGDVGPSGGGGGGGGGGPAMPQPGAPQGFNPFRALGPGEQASAQTFVDGQPVTNEAGQQLLRPPFRPGAQAAVDAMQGSIQDAYRAVSLGQQRGYPANVMDQLQAGVASDVNSYEQGIARLTMDPNAWERRTGVPAVEQTFADLQQGPAGYLTGPIRQDIAQTIQRYPETATIYKPLRSSYATLDQGTATDLVYGHQQELAALEDQRRFTPPEGQAALEQQIQDAHDRMLDTLFRADIPPNRAPRLTDWWQQNQPSPATPSRDLVDQYGTVLRNKRGDPKLYLSGRGTNEESLSNTFVNPGLFNGAGDGVLYFTDNPVVAGGDPFGQFNEPGYAATRAGTLEADRAQRMIEVTNLQAAIANFEQNGPASGITPEAYPVFKQKLAEAQAAVDAIPVPAPNVRPVFLAIKNPWDADEVLSFEAGNDIISAAEQHPDVAPGGFSFDDVRDRWVLMHESQFAENPTGSDLYKLLASAESTDPWTSVDPQQPTWTKVNAGTGDKFGKTRVNQVLQSMGHDAIRYDGGSRWGTDAGHHEAIAVFDPRSVIHAYLPPEALEQTAANLGIAMSKQFEVADSPLTPEIMKHAEITDADVAAAAAANHPGGLHVIRGITDLPSLMQGLQSQDFGGSYDGLIKAYRPVQHPSGRMDLMVSSLGQIDDQVVQDYNNYGLFKGASIVVKKSGKLGTVQEIYPDKVVWQSEAQAKRGPKVKTRSNHADVSLNVSSPETIDAPALYGEWQRHLMDETQARVRSSGQPDYVPEGVNDPEVFKRMVPLSNDFFASKGITDPGVKAALMRYFDSERIADIQDLDPQLRDLVAAQEQQIDALNAESREAPDIYAAAKQKGFNLVTNPQGGWILEDQFSPEKHQMQNDEAVRLFLDQAPVDRLPDDAPSSEVPPEAVPQYPHNEGHSEPNEDQLHDAMLQDVTNELDEEDADWAWMGDAGDATGINTPPGGGSSGSGAGGGQGGGAGGGEPPNRNLPTSGEPPYDPNRRPTGDQMSRREIIRRQLQGKGIDQLQQEWVRSLWRKLISPARVFFANLEQDLHTAGATDLRPWESFDKITAGMDQSHNFTMPFLDRIGTELTKVPGRALQDGTFARIWLMENPVDRALYAAGSGFKRPAIEAMQRIEGILNEMHGDGGQTVQDLKRFIAASRHNHETQSFGPSSYPDTYPSVDHFRDMASNQLMRFEKIDARSLFRNYVRSYGFKQYVASAWNDMSDTWNIVKNTRVEGRTPYAPLADMVLDWMDFVKRGPEPGKDLAVRAVNRMLNMFGVPLTHGETRKLMQTFQSSMYNALQGWRVHVIVRDSSQPLLAGPTVGFGNLAGAYKNAVRFGSEERNAMMQRAYDMGVTQHRMPRYEGTGAFEADSPETQASFSPAQNAIRAAGRTVGYAVRDATPAWVRSNKTSKFMPLAAYTAEGEWNRIIVGEAAHSNFMYHWNAYLQQLKIAGVTGDMTLAPSPDQFIRDINADSFRPAIARRILGLVKSGQIEGANGALGTYMRAVADRTQFTYGGRHAPMAVHSTAARMGYAFGNFATQFGALTKEFSAYGSLAHRFRALATIAGVSGAFELLHRKTGWNFRNYEWWQSLLFTGSPLAAGAVNAWAGANAARQVITSENASPNMVREAAQTIAPGNWAPALFRTYNPLQGAIYTGSGISKAMESPDPVTGLARLFITGDTHGGAVDWSNQFQNHDVNMGMMPPAPSTIPTRAVPVAQTDRSQFAPVRLPGSNQYQGHDAAYQQMMNDMLNIDRKYGGRTPGGGAAYNPPASDSLGGGAGGR